MRREVNQQGLAVIILFFFVVVMVPQKRATAQSIYLGKDTTSGLALMGGIGSAEKLSGPLFGLSYSVNGYVDVGFSYGNLSKDRDKTSSFAFTSSILFAKQYDGKAVNFELIPSMQRSYLRYDNSINQTTISLGIALSRDLANNNSNNSEFKLIPRLGTYYGNHFIDGNNRFPSKGGPNENFFIISGDVILGFGISNTIDLILNPGITYDYKSESVGLAISSGFLF